MQKQEKKRERVVTCDIAPLISQFSKLYLETLPTNLSRHRCLDIADRDTPIGCLDTMC